MPKVTEWFENGEIEQEATFKDGKCISGDCNLFVCVETEAQERDGIIYLPNETKPFTGNNMCVYANGQFKSQGKVKDGKKNGKQINWYESGQTMYEHHYKDGTEDGKWTSWYENGQIKYEKSYKDGTLVSKTIYAYHDNGQIKYEKSYKDGR